MSHSDLHPCQPLLRTPAVLTGIAAFALAAACTSPAPTDPKTDAKQDEQVEPAPEEADPKPVTEAEAKAVFEAWLAAQSSKNFDAYAAVYAEDFDGIKRNGHNTRHLEREAWLASRKKQFARDFSITATGLKLDDGKQREAGAMIAHFTQRWTTPTFADIGPKELLIARRGETAMVIHEEMISSHVTRRKGQTDSPISVLELGGAHYAVLGSGRPGWVDNKAKPTLLDDDTVTKPLLSDRVSKPMLEWIGREVEVSDKSGTPCRAKVVSLEVVGRVYPSPELDEELMNIYEEREPTDEELAPSMWSMISPDLFLIGKLDGNCTGNLALPVEANPDATAVHFTLTHEPEAKLVELAQRGFSSLPDYLAEQALYDEHLEDMKEWAEADEIAAMAGAWDKDGDNHLQLWTAGDERFLFRSVAVGEGCGDWSASMWALWKIGAGDELEFVGTGPESGDFSGTSGLSPTRLLRWHDNLWIKTDEELYEIQPKGDAMLIHATEPVFFGCPC